MEHLLEPSNQRTTRRRLYLANKKTKLKSSLQILLFCKDPNYDNIIYSPRQLGGQLPLVPEVLRKGW